MRTDAGSILLPIARAAISRELGRPHDTPAADSESWLQEPGATFVTLTRDGQLRGCIGTLHAHRPVLEDVKANAVAAAFRDPRFKPLTAAELEAVSVELSVLSAVEPMAWTSEQNALSQLRPGVDGVIFEYGHHTSTFLPQVWDTLANPAEFLWHLKRKAGLPPDFWDPEVKVSRYTVSRWLEESSTS